MPHKSDPFQHWSPPLRHGITNTFGLQSQFPRVSLVCELSGRVSTSFVRFAIQSDGEKLGSGTKPSDLRRGSGADDETTRRNSESNGQEDQLAGSGRDNRLFNSLSLFTSLFMSP